MADGQLRKPVNPNIPLVDPRNDLLKAIRDGEFPMTTSRRRSEMSFIANSYNNFISVINLIEITDTSRVKRSDL